MLYAAPTLDRAEQDVLRRIDDIRGRVHFVTAEPKAWAQLLVPLFLAADDTDTDGDAKPDDSAAPRAPARPSPPDGQAFGGYREALQYILFLHDDPHFSYHEALVRSLHYMTLAHDPDKYPGRWRAATIVVYGKHGQEVLYEPPSPELVPGLMHELMVRLNERDGTPVIVRASIAHLNLVQIHPFSDGNGRMGRALQTLVLVRDGILDPEFSSIEKSVARDRDRYRESLYALGPSWSPGVEARPFIRYCLAAHLDQAEQALTRASRMSAVWAETTAAIRAQGLPERLTNAVADAVVAGHVDAAAYAKWAGIEERRARADLRKLADRGFLSKRSGPRALYEAGPTARDIHARAWAAYPRHQPIDPFA